MGLKRSEKRQLLFKSCYYIILNLYALTIYMQRIQGEEKEFSDSFHNGNQKSMWDIFYYFHNGEESHMESNLKN